MSQRITRSTLLASTMLLGFGLPTMAAAQDGSDEIIVTGTRIQSANAVATSPVTTIGNVEFEIRGTTRVEDMINTLPQAFAAQGSNTSNGATGTAQVALRGLGANRTLVLINGRRMQYGSMISSAADLNQVPSALIERVDVLTGGASAVYGSDAIAGVVNFIMIDDFEGVRINGQLSGYQHSNNNQAAQDVLTAAAASPSFGSDLSIPERGVFDGKGQEITLIIGANTEDGRGNVTAYAGYRNNDAVLQADRDFSKCAYSSGDPVYTCAGSSTTPLGRFFNNGILNPLVATPGSSDPGPDGVFGDFGPDGLPRTADDPTDPFADDDLFFGDLVSGSSDLTLDENNPGFFRNRNSGDAFNYNPTNFYQRPDERFTLGAFARYEVNKHLEFYSEAMLYDYTSDAQIAFTGSFFETSQINCDNPLLSAAQVTALCSPYAVDNNLDGNPDTTIPDTLVDPLVTGEDVTFYPGKRFVEGRPRNNAIRNQAYRILGGIRGEAFDGWTYDASFQYATTRGSNTYDNDAVIPNMQEALFAVSDGAGGVQCRSASARSQGCVPLNLFQVNGVTQAQLDYFMQQSFQLGATKQFVGEATMSGDLGQYGFKMPMAETGIGLAFGVQWRKDSLEYTPDALFEFGLLSGQGGPTPPISGSIENTDFFVETSIPLVEGQAFAERLTFNGGYRHSDVSTAGAYSTWKLAGDWQIVPEIRVRGGWQRAARAPNVIEAFTPQAVGLTDIDDGCVTGAENPYTAAGCANTNGGSPLSPGTIPPNPAGQYNALFGGNAALTPEVSDTYTIGVVLTPGDVVPGRLFVSVDYFNISVDDFISTINPQTALDQCATTADPFFCNLVNRAPNGSLWITQQGFITATNVNTGSLSTSGIDINANWGFDFNDIGLGNAGGINFDLVGTYLIDLKTLELPDGTVPEYDCAGWYSVRCGNSPNPEWRHKLRTTWETPLGVDATLTWRYYGSVVHGDSVSGERNVPTNLNHTLGSRNYIDLAASYNVTDKWNVTVGVNNLLDKDPPLTSQTFGRANGNTFPQTYDSLGRYLFLGTTVDF